jgi:benzoate-CoA ligase
MSADLAPLVEEVRDELPALKQLLAVGGALAGHVDFHALTRDSDPTVGHAFEPKEHDAAFLLYSANAARGVAHGHEAPLVAFRNYARAVLALGQSDRVFTTSRLSTAFGLGMGLLFPLLAGAATCLLPARPRPRAIFDVLLACHPTIFASTPSLYGQLLHDWRELGSRSSCFESVRHVVSGGEALPESVSRRFRNTFGKSLLHGFGATEALHFVISNRPGEEREGATGRLLEGVEARVVDESGRPLAAKEMGSLELRAPTMARGYWGREPWPKDGWLRTGDRFFFDDDGVYFHCGRTDDQFKVSGRWVAPDEVERTLLGHPSVWECAVVEGHDEDGLAQTVAYVVTNVGHEPTTDLAAQLMEFVKREIAPWKYPREIHFVESLPKDDAGRVQRWRLRRRPA